MSCREGIEGCACIHQPTPTPPAKGWPWPLKLLAGIVVVLIASAFEAGFPAYHRGMGS